MDIGISVSGNFDGDDALREVMKEIERDLRSVRCPVHGRRPTVKAGRRGRNFVYDIEGCCERVVAEAERVIS